MESYYYYYYSHFILIHRFISLTFFFVLTEPSIFDFFPLSIRGWVTQFFTISDEVRTIFAWFSCCTVYGILTEGRQTHV